MIMFSDVVIPENNEKEFLEVASRLGIKKIYFLYDFDEYDKQRLAGLGLIDKKIRIEFGFIVNQKNFKKAINHSRFLVAKSSDKDRFFIESNKIKMIYGFEELHKRDYLHQRASGLNHIICEIARQNNVAVGFSYSSLLGKSEQTSSLIIGRIMQNIRMCQKYKVKTIIGSFSHKPFELRAPHDMITLFNLLGMDGKIAKDSLDYRL